VFKIHLYTFVVPFWWSQLFENIKLIMIFRMCNSHLHLKVLV
jgi:hypothetical protein